MEGRSQRPARQSCKPSPFSTDRNATPELNALHGVSGTSQEPVLSSEATGSIISIHSSTTETALSCENGTAEDIRGPEHKLL